MLYTTPTTKPTYDALRLVGPGISVQPPAFPFPDEVTSHATVSFVGSDNGQSLSSLSHPSTSDYYYHIISIVSPFHHLAFPHPHLSMPYSKSTYPILIKTVTRSHKFNDREYQAPEGGVISPQENLPRFFGKSGPTDSDPKKTKKDGGGKGNW